MGRNSESLVHCVTRGIFRQRDIERAKKSDGECWSEEFQQAINRRGMPGIQGQEEITLSYFLGDELRIERSAPPFGTHFNLANRTQADIGKEISPRARHTYQGKTRGKEGG